MIDIVLTTDFCISTLRKIIFNETQDPTIQDNFKTYLFCLSLMSSDALTEYLDNLCDKPNRRISSNHEYDNTTTTTNGYDEDDTSLVSVLTTTNNCSSLR